MRTPVSNGFLPTIRGWRWRCARHALALAFLYVPGARAATVTWDGGGGDFSWQNPANWSGDVLPGINDSALINSGGDITVTSSASVTILSLQCSNNLALSAGTFRVRAGDSIVHGRLLTAGTPALSATGAVTSFTVVGPVFADGASFEAIGATISLPGLATFAKGPSCAQVVWTANGSGALLDFPNLITVTGANCASLIIQSLAGGQIQFPSLTTLNEGHATFLADGAGSLVDLPAATRSVGTVLRTVTFEARNNGTIAMPLFTGGNNAAVTLRTGGTLPVAQLTGLAGFNVSGTNVDFTALTNLNLGNVTVDGGAVVRATSVAAYGYSASCPVHAWRVSGAGSVLDLSGLTNLAGENCGYLAVQATSGGTLVLSNLTRVGEGNLDFLADGTNSLLDLGALNQSLATTREVTFEARNNGTLFMPLFTGGSMVTFTLKGGGSLPAAQFTRLRGFTVESMALELTALTNLGTGSVLVNGGGQVTLPGLVIHDVSMACIASLWGISGAGSVLDVSQLKSLNGATCGYLEVDATDGGAVLAGSLTNITEGLVTFKADGTNSIVDLSALAASPGSARVVTLDACNAGTILAPSLPGGQNVFVSLQSGGTLPVAQLRELRGFTVGGMNVTFPALTNLTIGSVTASGGGVATVPTLTSHNLNGTCPANTWLATGAGSVLDFPQLSSLTGPGCSYLNLQATAGGTLRLDSLGTISDGIVYVLADGTNSLVDLGALTEVLTATRAVSFEARNAGTIVVPLLQGGPTVTVNISSGGALDAEQMTLLKGLTVSGTTLVLPGLTNLFAGDLTVSTGAVLRLPALQSHNHGNSCSVNTWLATGAGSLLDLSALTNLSGPTCGRLVLQAQSSGAINLTNLLEISGGGLDFVSDGAGSLIDAAALLRSSGTAQAVSFEVRNAGTVAMPLMTGGPTVGIVIKTNGTLPIAQLTRLGSIVVMGTNATFPGLTNFDNGSFAISNGAAVSVPNLAAYSRGSSCTPATWVVRGTNSALDLPGLASLNSGTCTWLDVQALAGGQLLLGSVAGVASGTVRILSSGGGSLLDLHSLANLLDAGQQSSLTTSNGGTVLFSSEPAFLSGVALNIAAGTPGLAPASLGAANLVMHSQPWRGYWVERRDTASLANPWIFYRRVPLTNEFQVIGPPVGAGVELRAWEFVADPYLLDFVRSGTTPQLVLYAPAGRTLEVDATTNLTPVVVWTNLAVVAMTNTFRLFPPEPPGISQRYFKAITY